MIGYPFTWAKSRGTPNAIEERIDRALVAPSWSSLFPQAKLANHSAPLSDHNPILLTTENKLHYAKRKGFRFENSWLNEPGFSDIVRENWEMHPTRLLPDRLAKIAETQQQWGKRVSRKFRDEIDKCKRELEELRFRNDSESVHHHQDLNSKLIRLLTQEEDFWKQRAKNYWLKDGDLNSRFFHRIATTRREVNRIKNLRDDTGNYYDHIDDLCRIAKQYFNELYSPIEADCDLIISKTMPVVSATDNSAALRK
ncbi:uncharacterized protein [Primulina eburnea]|uniref:uncharacterized protein n=1 Tax=Primulina eburnea TaxID=1245227 RepID=UPI003C6CAA73